MGFQQDALLLEDVVQGRDPAFSSVPFELRMAGLKTMHAAAKAPDRDAFLLAAMRLVALPRNGHSRVIPNAAIQVAPRRILMRNAAAVIVIGRETLQILSINGVTPEKLIEAWSDLLAGTKVRRRMLSGLMMAWPAALAAVGAGGEALYYELSDGSELSFGAGDLCPALPLYPVSDTGFLDPDLDEFWLASGGFVAWQDGVWRIRIASLKQASESDLSAVIDVLASRPAAGLVFDLRGNTGGDFTKAVRLIEWLGGHWKGARCAILVNGYTFSAAIVVAVLLVHHLGDRTRVIGERVGDDLEFYAEGGSLELPQSGAILRYSTGWHDWRTGGAGLATPEVVARHMVGIGALEIMPVSEELQLQAAISFARNV